MTDREIMQTALVTLKNCLPVNYCYNNFGEASPMYKKDGLSVEKINESIKSLEAALAQPEQKSPHSATHSADSAEGFGKREWQGLTEDEIKKIMQQALTVLKEWDALIKHQYSGSSEAMTDMQYAAWHTVDVIKDIEALQNALTQPEHLDLRKAAKMALEALENFCEYGAIQQPIEKRDALRQALAQPEQSKYSDIVSDGGLDPRNKFDAQQEPVAWMDKVWMKRPDLAKEIHMNKMFSRCQLSDKQVPLYTAPLKQWVGLTDEEIKESISNLLEDDPTPLLTLADVIQERLKEKHNG